MHRSDPPPCEPAEIGRFLDTFLYQREAFFVDEIVRIDRASRVIEGRMHTDRDLPLARFQRTAAHHPPHVSAPELLMATGSLGCLHAWFFHGCRWADGWAAFGSRIHRADFKNLARLGPPVRLESRETRSRVGSRRLVLRFSFRFWQQGSLVYVGDQTAMFLRNQDFSPRPQAGG